MKPPIKDTLTDLLSDLCDYMENLSDADGDSEGIYPNEEMRLEMRIKDALIEIKKLNQ